MYVIPSVIPSASWLKDMSHIINVDDCQLLHSDIVWLMVWN